jgi:hypothetical protein
MKKFILTIPEPCHEDWEKMTPEAKGRFCGSCQKTVIDYTDMSDRQLAEFFKRPTGSICGRLRPDQLDKELAVPRRRLPWVRYFFQFALPAFLVSLKAGAQKTTAPSEVTCTTPYRMMGKVAYRPDTTRQMIAGTVKDRNGQPVPFATVSVKGALTVTTNEKGYFHFEWPGDIPPVISISASGFVTQETQANSNTIVRMIDSPQVLLGMTGGLIVVRKPKKAVPLMKPVKDTAAGRYTVFPNPATAGSLVTVSFRKQSDMPASVALYTSTGRLVMNVPLTSAKPALVFNLQLPAYLASGSYILQLNNHASLKLIVE